MDDQKISQRTADHTRLLVSPSAPAPRRPARRLFTAGMALILGSAALSACFSGVGAPAFPPHARDMPGAATSAPAGTVAEAGDPPCPWLPNDKIYRFIAGEDRCAAAMDESDIKNQLNDPFATHVLRKRQFPTTADDVARAIREAGTGLMQKSFVVAEGGQIPTTVVSRDVTRRGRYVVAWTSPTNAEMLMSSRVIPKDPFIEVLAWDPVKKSANFYVYTNDPGDERPYWTWAGDSGRARGERSAGKGCFGCHHGGTVIMKELQVPWSNWSSTSAQLDGAHFPEAVAAHPLFNGKENANVLEEFVRSGVRRHYDQWLASRVNGGKIRDAGEVLRHVVLNTTVNMASSSDASERGPAAEHITGLPPGFFASYELFKDMLGIRITQPDPQRDLVIAYRSYREWLRANRSRLENDRPEYEQPGDTFFAFFVPVPSFEDSVVIGQLLDGRWVSDKLVAAVQMVDFQNPVLSTRRSKLQQYANEIKEATRMGEPGSIDEQLVALIRRGAEGHPACEPKDVDACTPERQFLHYYDQKDWKDTVRITLDQYSRAVAAKLKSDGGAAYLRLAVARRHVLSNWTKTFARDLPSQSTIDKLDEFTLLFPKTSLPNTVFRMTPKGEISETTSP